MSSQGNLKPAVFLDRDGVLNKDIGYLYRIEDFEWVDGSRMAIKYLNENGYYVFVVTNQSGVARRYYSLEDVERLHLWMNDELAKDQARIDDFRIAPTHPDHPSRFDRTYEGWRKPDIGMLLDLQKSYNIDLQKSFLIGDKESDMHAAQRFGIKGFKFGKNANNLFEFMNEMLH